jgi:hypothetical protein
LKARGRGRDQREEFYLRAWRRETLKDQNGFTPGTSQAACHMVNGDKPRILDAQNRSLGKTCRIDSSGIGRIFSAGD